MGPRPQSPSAEYSGQVPATLWMITTTARCHLSSYARSAWRAVIVKIVTIGSCDV
jgi:hypothetical protein